MQAGAQGPAAHAQREQGTSAAQLENVKCVVAQRTAGVTQQHWEEQGGSRHHLHNRAGNATSAHILAFKLEHSAYLLSIHAMPNHFCILVVLWQVADMAAHHVQHPPLIGDALPVQCGDALYKMVVDMIDIPCLVCMLACMHISQ